MKERSKVDTLAKEFSICKGTIYNIIKGLTWTQCRRPENLATNGIITQSQAQKIIDLFVEGSTTRELSLLFDLSVGNIAAIIKGVTWKKCKRPDNICNLLKKTIKKETAQLIIDEYCKGEAPIKLAKKYGICRSSVNNLISGKTYPACHRPENIKNIAQERAKNSWFEKGRICYIDAPPLTDFQMDIIIGSLLGDGSINYKLANSNFTKNQSKNRFDYLKWHHEVLCPYSVVVDPVFSKEKLIGKNRMIVERKKVKKHLSGYKLRTHHHPVFTQLRQEWYPQGVKAVPKNLVLNPQRIAIWFFDDGSNHVPNRTSVICTQSFTFEDVEFLCEKLKPFNLEPRIIKVFSEYTSKYQPIIKLTKSSYDNIIDMIKPYCFWDCFKYKTEWRPAKKQWETSGKFTEEQAKQVLEMRKTIPAKEIARFFGVHVNTIYAMVSGRSWGHLRKI